MPAFFGELQYSILLLEEMVANVGKGMFKKKLLIVIDPITAEPTNKSPPTSGTPTLPSSKLRWQ